MVVLMQSHLILIPYGAERSSFKRNNTPIRSGFLRSGISMELCSMKAQ